MSLQKPAARKSSPRTAARFFNENATPSSCSPRSPAEVSNKSGGTDGLNRIRLTNNRSLPSPLDQIDPRRWKHFPRFSTTSDFATFPFSDIDVSEEEAHLSADEHSIIGIKSSVPGHGSEEQTLAMSTPEARIRSAAAGIRRAVSDNSNKIKRMTLKLKRAPSTLLNRSRSRVFGSQSPVAIHSGYEEPPYSNLCSPKQEEIRSLPQPSDTQPLKFKRDPAKASRSNNQVEDDKSSITSHAVTSWHIPSRIQSTIEASHEGELMNDQKIENISQASICPNESIQDDSTSPATKIQGMSDSQRNSMMDRLASYPQESLAWLAKDSLQNASRVSLTDGTNTTLHELPGDCQHDRNKVSLPRSGGQNVSDTQKRLPQPSGQAGSAGHGTRQFTFYPRTSRVERDISDSPTSKYSVDNSVLLDNKTNSGHGTKFDEGTPTKARPSLRRTVSRIFRGDRTGENKENRKP